MLSNQRHTVAAAQCKKSFSPLMIKRDETPPDNNICERVDMVTIIITAISTAIDIGQEKREGISTKSARSHGQRATNRLLWGVQRHPQITILPPAPRPSSTIVISETHHHYLHPPRKTSQGSRILRVIWVDCWVKGGVSYALRLLLLHKIYIFNNHRQHQLKVSYDQTTCQGVLF